MQSQPDLDEATDRLERNATIVGVVPAVIVGLVLVLVHPIVGVVAAVALAVAWVLFVRARLSSAADRVLSGLDAAPLEPGRHPRLENLLEGLCTTSGVTDPSVALVRSDAMNALVAAGRDRTRIVLTTGLVQDLGRLELEGVLANLLGRVKDGSARYTTTVLALFGTSARAGALLGEHLGEQRSVLSDLAAVDLTRYPPGLVAAFLAMDERGTELSTVPPLTRPLWIATAAPSQGGAESVGDQPLSLRIAVLSEL